MKTTEIKKKENAELLVPKLKSIADYLKNETKAKKEMLLELFELTPWLWKQLLEQNFLKIKGGNRSSVYKWIGPEPDINIALSVLSKTNKDNLIYKRADNHSPNNEAAEPVNAAITHSRAYSIQEKGMLKTLEQLYFYLETTKKQTSIEIQLVVGINPEHWNKLVKGGIIVAVDNGSKGWKWAGIKPNIHMAIETLKESGKFDNLDNHLPFEPPTGKRYFKTKTKVTILSKLFNSAYEDTIMDDEIAAILLIDITHIKNLRLNVDCPYEVWERIRLWYSTGLPIREFKISANEKTPYIKPAVTKLSKQEPSQPEARNEVKDDPLPESLYMVGGEQYSMEDHIKRFKKEKKAMLLLIDHGTHQEFNIFFDNSYKAVADAIKEKQLFHDADHIILCTAFYRFSAIKKYEIDESDLELINEERPA